MNNKAYEILHRYFGYSSFRHGQERVINEILSGNDIVSIMPTGGGKSLCYQIPALMFEGMTIVISPLISLMKDQVDGIRKNGIEADFINSSLSSNELSIIIEKIKNNNTKILYIAPERLESERFLEALQKVDIDFVAVDEAHCVSQWGHDFRSSYRNIKDFIVSLKKRPILGAFTATATNEVQEDIINLLKLKNPRVFIDGFDRENLELTIIKGENKKEFIMSYIKANPEQCGIIYAATRKETDSLYEYLSSKGIPSACYHAGLSENERNVNQEAFVYDRVNVIVATNAFGMGIDKPNVRFVIHYNMPKNIESYYQEIGRAGRDGEKSDCILLFSPGDIQTQKYLIETSISNPERKINDYKKLQNMVDLIHTNSCIRSYILNYFGEDGMDCCNNCSNCKNEGELIDKTLDAQKVLSCIFRMQKPYGVNMVVDVLRDSENKKLLGFKFNQLSTYGIMKNYSKDDLKNFINMLISHSYINVIEGEYPVITLNEASYRILKREERVIFKETRKVERSFVNNSLFDILRILRRTISMEEGVPPYIIFGDNMLKEMSSRYPLTIEQFLDINGVGELKASKYGARFLEEINRYVTENNIDTNWNNNKNPIENPKETEKLQKEKSSDITIKMLRDNYDIVKVAKERGLTIGTVLSHIYEYLNEGNRLDFDINYENLFDKDTESIILTIIKEVGESKLKPIKEKLPEHISYDQIKAVIMKNSNKAV